VLKITKPSAKNIANGQLNVLITRPEEKSKQLAFLLQQQGIANISQPLFDYQDNTTEKAVENALENTDIIIFVSIAAVEFTHRCYDLTRISSKKIIFIAVGHATKEALLSLGISDVLVPEQENSEGVLLLPVLEKVKNKNIVIFRGNGGREHIATKLTQRGAKICYIESYQRVWRTLAKTISQQWQAQQINCIVVTSNDSLMALLTHLKGDSAKLSDYWQFDCLWLVVSSRIESNAKKMGLQKVVNSHGANTERLKEAIKAISVSETPKRCS
jgi:uroporphyrinogen-III synthase